MGEVAPERDYLPFAVLPLTNTKEAKHWRCGDKLKNNNNNNKNPKFLVPEREEKQ